MKRRISSVIVVIAGTLALFPALTHGAAATRTVAFHGTYTVSIVIVGGLGNRHGSGSASLLGKSVLHAVDGGSPYTGCGGVEGEGSLKAKGGSMLRYIYMLGFCRSRGDTVKHGYYVVIGGTGRFANASGSGTLSESDTATQDVLRTTFHGSLILY